MAQMSENKVKGFDYKTSIVGLTIERNVIASFVNRFKNRIDSPVLCSVGSLVKGQELSYDIKKVVKIVF